MKWTLILYPIYLLLVWLYLFQWSDFGVPAAYQGSAADPATFMTDRQLELSQEYSRYRNFLSLATIPLEWIIYLGVFLFGLSHLFKKFGESISRFRIVSIPIYVLLLSGLSWFLTFPFDYAYRFLSVRYGISTDTFSGWMRDEMISFWIGYITMALLITVLYLLMQRFEKRWWLYAWIGLIPFIALMMFIQPVIIDPLYNDFYELQDKQLEEKILALADEAEVPADRVYEVNMSEETNSMNAYVNGIGSSLRIVLWDTTLTRLKDNEVLFIMAHEIGHYVMNHLYWNLVGVLAGSFVGLYLTYRILTWLFRRYGERMNIKGAADIAGLPVLFIVLSILSFVAQPIEMTFSRGAEADADRYAIEMTGDVDAAIGSFQELTVNGLSDVNPPAVIKYLYYGHPTMMERIHMLEEYQE
ncbi:M48 family metallopeptidase [Halobacillus salinus]|uniref:M48 family metallopeptidase n=1 Tax=Halobacillus salinus TaxID=192814 RepID=UPI0020CA9965|nr:M48 family metallopeptidase [Halobacillus salinus]